MVYNVVVFPDPVGPVKMVIHVFFSRFLFNISYVLSVNPIFSNVLILLVGSRNLSTVLSDSTPGIKFALTSTFLVSPLISVASNQNLPSCGM